MICNQVPKAHWPYMVNLVELNFEFSPSLGLYEVGVYISPGKEFSYLHPVPLTPISLHDGFQCIYVSDVLLGHTDHEGDTVWEREVCP